MPTSELLARITINPEILGGKPIIRGKRVAVEHILNMLAVGDDEATILEGYPWMVREDIQACLLYAGKVLSHEHYEPLIMKEMIDEPALAGAR